MATDVAPAAELLGVEEVIGSIIVANNSALTTVAANALRSVSNLMVLDNLPLLSNITLPMWSAVNTLILNKIPAPNVLNLQTTVQKVTNLYITDTTLETLFGLLLRTSQMENLVITGNKFLQDCWFGVGNITQQATIVDNSGTMSLTLPNLTYAYNMEITNASAISMPVLQSVNQHLDISWNTIQNLSLPELNYVGGEFSVMNNAQLTEMDIPDLVNVQGDVEISDNHQLKELSGLSKLAYIGGDLTAQGEFDDARLTSLGSVGGNISLQTTDGDATCADLPKTLARGTYACSAPGSGRKSISKGAIAGIVVAAVLGTAAIIGATLWCVLRRRKSRNDVREIVHPDGAERPPLPPKEKKTSYGYYDLKTAEQVVEGGRGPKEPDVEMHDLGRKHSELERHEEAFEMPTEANVDRREMPTSPTGAAVEMESPGAVIARDAR
ncbi:cell wall protein Ecm33 [Elasticomyces elasticus]|nr:cell wall protein Ecm33 [Elasticomyces elasticus]